MRVTAILGATITITLCILAGCSDGATGSGKPDVPVAPSPDVPNPPEAPDAGGGDDADASDNLGWGNQTEVESIVTTSCGGCHGFQSCWSIQAEAAEAQQEVSSGAMPEGTPLTASEKATLLEWLQDGAPCSGSQPAGQPVSVGVSG